MQEFIMQLWLHSEKLWINKKNKNDYYDSNFNKNAVVGSIVTAILPTYSPNHGKDK